MANKKRGYYTQTLGGRKRTLHFSMNFWANFTDTMNIPLDKIGDVLKGVFLSAIRALVYSAILAHDQKKATKLIIMNLRSARGWKFNPNRFGKIIFTMMESKILGNQLNMGIERNAQKTDKAGK